MYSKDYQSWFHRLTGHPKPRHWQLELAQDQNLRSRMIRIPTGMGKTEGVLSAWSYHRLNRGDESWPRRLVWCLPMRVLVEQTREVARSLADAINETLPGEHHIDVHAIMGGEESADWFLYPERAAIIVGTQDMLLSRALNRGYASSRARWPMEFGLLSQDALWVMDEVQLMDVGLATSAQLQAFREGYIEQWIRPCFTWWMSATLQPDWLKSVDTRHNFINWSTNPCTVDEQQRTSGLFDVNKSLEQVEISERDSKGFADLILQSHSNLAVGDHGRVTLVICNTVDRACDTFDAISAKADETDVHLVHSRFRPAEREHWRAEFLSREACNSRANRIIVATQVVEAGVDISASLLITELAPWPSLVQRFGRCARYGGRGHVLVVDRQFNEKNAAPYSIEELQSASWALQQLADVGLKPLEEFEESLDNLQREQLYPYHPEHLLMETEFDELFDTTPDLTGADIDVSRFIRSGDERDLQVFWIDLGKNEKPDLGRSAGRLELCSVPFLKARDWLCGIETKSTRKPNLLNRMKDRVWVWDWIDGDWKFPRRSELLPGRIICVAADRGGYRQNRGFDPESLETVPEIRCNPISERLMDSTLPLLQGSDATTAGEGDVLSKHRIGETVHAMNQADRRQGGDQLSSGSWKTIALHCRETAELMVSIAREIDVDEGLMRVLRLAALWHDVGKAHPAFQNMLRRRRDDIDAFSEHLLAKSENADWRNSRYFADAEERDERIGFRHELASALALFAILQHFAPLHPALLGEWADWLEQQNGAGAVQAPVPLAPPAGTGAGGEGPGEPLSVRQVLDCSAADFNLLVYLVASHHGKVRAGLHASPNDQDYVDRLGDGKGLPIRGIREGDILPPLSLDEAERPLAPLTLTLTPANLGISNRTGISWRERTLRLQNEIGPTCLAYLEALLRAADVRASQLNTQDPTLNVKELV